MKLSELQPHPPKILLTGTFGVGKTLLATSVGETAQVLDLNNGLRSAIMFKDSFTTDRAKVDVIQCLEPDPTKAIAYSKCKSYIESIAGECRIKTYKYKVLIVDGFTDLAEYATRAVLSDNGLLAKGAAPQIQHWGLAFNNIENVLITLKSLPIAVILIAHMRRYETDDGSTKFEIATPGKKLPEKIPTFFDEVWFMDVKYKGNGVNEHVVQTTSTSVVPCRSRDCVATNQLASIGMKSFLKQCGYDVTK